MKLQYMTVFTITSLWCVNGYSGVELNTENANLSMPGAFKLSLAGNANLCRACGNQGIITADPETPGNSASVLLAANSSTSDKSLTSTESQVVAVFEKYREGIKQKNAQTVYETIDQRSKDFYEQLRLNAIILSNEDLMQKKTEVDRFNILYLRHKIGLVELVGMSGFDVFSSLVANMETMNGLDFDKVTYKISLVTEDNAGIDLYNAQGEWINTFTYIKEKSTGLWKFELWPHRGQGVWSRIRKAANLSEREFVFMMLESATGQKPSDKLMSVFE